MGKLFDYIDQRDLVSWIYLISSAYAQIGDLCEIVSLSVAASRIELKLVRSEDE